MLDTDLFRLIKQDRLEIDLQGAVLRGYKLEGASFDRSNFQHAILVETDLSNAFLLHANFSGAIMRNADLSGAALFDANLSNTNLDTVDLEEALYDTDTIWPKGFDPAARGAILTTIEDWEKNVLKKK